MYVDAAGSPPLPNHLVVRDELCAEATSPFLQEVLGRAGMGADELDDVERANRA